MNLPLFLAQRIYRDKTDKRRVSRPAIRIATIGVAIGLAVMIVSVCVVMGFKNTIRNKVVGFGADITVADFMTMQTANQFPIAMGDSMTTVLRRLPGVKHVQRYALKQGILKTDDDFLGVMLKGIGPDYDTTFIASNIVEGSMPKFSDTQSTNNIVISKKMASKLKLHAGQKVFAYFINEQGVRMRRFRIAAIYETNLSRFDATICYCDLYTANKLNGWEPDQYSGAEIIVKNAAKRNATAAVVEKTVNKTVDRYGGTYHSETIEEMNPQIFSWLSLMDLNVWIIICLMIAVAGVTIISGLLIIILERTKMIGLLKALGARNSQVRHLFLWFATFIILRGLILGNILAFAIVLMQRYTGFVKLDPQTYYVSEVPVEISIPVVVAINIVTLAICIVVLIAPSFLISHIHPAKTMHFE